MRKIVTVAVIMSLSLAACKKDDQQKEAQKIIAEWVGKTIEFPAAINLSVYGKDTLLPDFHSTPYKILLYVDSTGCTSCRMKLHHTFDNLNEINIAS